MVSDLFRIYWVMVLLLALLGISPDLLAEPLRLTPEKTVIITPPNPSPQTSAAASLLKKWLRRAARNADGFETVTSETTAAQNAEVAIVLGDPADLGQQALPEDGYVLKRISERIFISGKSDAGTFFGSVALLDHLGVRFYMPTDEFTSLPKTGDLLIDDLKVISAPWVQSVFFSGINIDDRPAATWARLNGVWRRKGGTHQHNSFEMFPPKRYAERYPEIYPTIQGKRYIPASPKDQSWQLNYAEPKLVDVALESIDLYFQSNPKDSYVALSIQDGSRFDQSPQTMEVIERFRVSGEKAFKDRAFSHLYWRFMAQVASKMQEKWPGKLLVGLAYGPTRFPPAERLPDNVMAFTNFHIAELPADRFLQRENGGAPTLSDWLNVSSHYGNHDWYQGSGYFIPRIYSGYWSQFLRQAKQHVSSAYMHVETYPNWGFDGPKYYVLSRLMWNPDENPKAILSRMCTDLFGEGADAMNSYFSLLDRLWNELNYHENHERKLGAYRSQGKTTPTSRAMIVEARQRLGEALSKATEPDEKARITLFSDCFRISEYFFEFAQAKSLEKERLDKALEFSRASLKKHGAMLAHHPHNLAPALIQAASPVLKKAAVEQPMKID